VVDVARYRVWHCDGRQLVASPATSDALFDVCWQPRPDGFYQPPAVHPVVSSKPSHTASQPPGVCCCVLVCSCLISVCCRLISVCCRLISVCCWLNAGDTDNSSLLVHTIASGHNCDMFHVTSVLSD